MRDNSDTHTSFKFKFQKVWPILECFGWRKVSEVFVLFLLFTALPEYQAEAEGEKITNR